MAMPRHLSLRGERRHDKKQLFVSKSGVTFIVHYYFILTVNHLAC